MKINKRRFLTGALASALAVTLFAPRLTAVINFKTIAGSPQVSQIFSDWDVVSPISDSVFTFVPPDGASKIVVNPKKAEDASDGVPTDAPAKK